jgi:hypothetical protein
VRPGRVVIGHPRIQGRLQLGQRRVLAVRGPDELGPHRPAGRAAFPVVVGEYGLVNRCLIPLSRQIRSNRTGPGPRPNLAVNTLPLSVRICSGIPCRRNASVSAWHTGRAVARRTAFAQTTNREWSSIPVTILTSVPSARNTLPITSICHRSIARGRSRRR